MHEIRGYGLVYKEVARLITSGHLGILLLVIPLGVTGLKKTRKRERGQCDLVCVECLWMIKRMVVMLMSYSRVVSVVLVL